MKRCDKWRIELKQRLPAGADDIGPARRFGVGAPDSRDQRGDLFGRPVLAAILAIGADKVCITKLANRFGPVTFEAAP